MFFYCMFSVRVSTSWYLLSLSLSLMMGVVYSRHRRQICRRHRWHCWSSICRRCCWQEAANWSPVSTTHSQAISVNLRKRCLWHTHCKDTIPKILNKYWSAYSAARKYVDRSREYINRSQTLECGNWDWGRAFPFLGIHKWDIRCSAWCTLCSEYLYDFKNLEVHNDNGTFRSPGKEGD